jgi:hypothetical protein
MKNFKHSIAFSFLIGTSLLAGTDDPSMDLLIKKLVEKGVLKADEADAIVGEMKQAVAQRNQDLAHDKTFTKALMGKNVPLRTHTDWLEVGGLHYIGLTANRYGENDTTGSNRETGFELRRNYLDLKAKNESGDYIRFTLDATKELAQGTTAMNPKIKYAYIWLNEVLPYTGVEIGSVHRPWIDYEENNGWFYRSINKVVLEDKFAIADTTAQLAGDPAYRVPGLISSAEIGFNLKTKTPYFSSELGLFNGEGYDGATAKDVKTTGMSFEWRLSAHLLGTGKENINPEKSTYANLSFAGIQNSDMNAHKHTGVGGSYAINREGYWFHALYNQPEFLIAAQYDVLKDVHGTDATHDTEYEIWSVNGEYRPFKNWSVIGRFDNLETTYNTSVDQNRAGDASQYIYGVAYTVNKNLKVIANGKTVDTKNTNVVPLASGATTPAGNLADKQSYMVTGEVKW